MTRQTGLQTILQTGENFEGSTVSELGFTGTHFLLNRSPDTSFDGLNNSGQVAFAFSLSNNRHGLAVWSPDALDGDFNADGIVDAADYIVWRKTDGSQAGYDLWRTNFGRTVGARGRRRQWSRAAQSGSPRLGEPTTAVPEPASLLMALAAWLATVFRRRVVDRSY